MSEQPGDVSNSNDEYYLEIHTALASGFDIDRCYAHAIQLAAQDVFEAIGPQIDECRQVIEFLRKHSRVYKFPY